MKQVAAFSTLKRLQVVYAHASGGRVLVDNEPSYLALMAALESAYEQGEAYGYAVGHDIGAGLMEALEKDDDQEATGVRSYLSLVGDARAVGAA